MRTKRTMPASKREPWSACPCPRSRPSNRRHPKSKQLPRASVGGRMENPRDKSAPHNRAGRSGAPAPPLLPDILLENGITLCRGPRTWERQLQRRLR